MSMTEKDFEAIAAAIQKADDYVFSYLTLDEYGGATIGLGLAAMLLATVCEEQYKGNGRFDREKFLEATGIPEADFYDFIVRKGTQS